jgi:FkbM family methyltransferase
MKKFIVLNYIRLIYFFQKYFSIRLKGLGRVQRFLKNEFVFDAFGRKFFYDPKIEGSYDYLLIGESNESETRLFLDWLLPKLERFTFIDIGASIGEFINLASIHRNKKNILAFEPRVECSEVLIKNVKLNNDSNTEIWNLALSNFNGDLELSLNAGGSSSGIYATSSDYSKKTIVQSRKLDDLELTQLNEACCDYILLIDVEGAEPMVLEGARNFIKNKRPLIIFEYNNTSKKYFNLEDIKQIIGIDYDIFRLNSEGRLDNNLLETWNCVAVPKYTVFNRLLLN